MTDKPEDEGSEADAASRDAPAEDKKAEAKKADAGGIPDKADFDADIPVTRRHESIPPVPDASEPPARSSALDLNAPITYPDDGPLSAMVRKIDNYVGVAEQVVLVTILVIVVLTAATHALLDRFAHIRVPFKDDVIRSGTFAIAMLAGAFASHQAKHLSMDLISRRLSARSRLFLKVALGVFVIFMVVLLIRSGFHNITNEQQFQAEDKLITRVRIAWLIPIGGSMIIFHTVLHAIIDVDYILRRKTPPEKMRSGH